MNQTPAEFTGSDEGRDPKSGIAALRASDAFRGPVEPPDGHDSNEHIVQVCDTREEQLVAALPYIRQGLDRGEQCLYVADDHSKADVLAAMREHGIDVDGKLDSGALTVLTGDAYLQNDQFSIDDQLAFLAEAIEDATEEYEVLRVAVEMTWFLRDESQFDDLIEYEERFNTLSADTDVIALCQYNRDRFPPAVIRDAIRSHAYLLSDDTLCHNVYYTPPGEFFGPDQPAREVDRMVRTLRERTEAKTELKKRQQYLRKQNEITASPDRTFEEKLQALFELGCDRFDLELGAMARVDAEEDWFEVEYVSDDHEHFEPGVELPLSETYCTAATEIKAAGSVSNPREGGYDDITVYQEFGLQAYLGTYVEVAEGTDRTFFFVTSEPREDAFSDDERAFVRLIGQWVAYELKQTQREDQLAALNALSRAVMQAETEREVCETVVEAAETALGLPATAIALYDGQDGRLRPAAATAPADAVLEATPLLDRGDGSGWTAFIENEPCRIADPLDGTGASIDPPIHEIAVFPLGNHGILITGSTATDGFSASTGDVVETVAATTEAALDRADREQQLHAREETLREQNETLERLNRVSDVIRRIDQVLVQASTRDEIVQAVCDRLVSAESYRFAWVGTQDAVTADVTPEAWAGIDDGFLETVTVTVAEDDDENGLTEAAVRTRETQVWNNLAAEPPFEPWRQAALDRGYLSGIAVPLIYQGTSYGVLTLYAEQPDVFDEMEEAVLAELGETIGYALNALEQKRALVSEQSVELEFQLRAGTSPLFQVAAEFGCEVAFENIVHRTDELPRIFVTIRGVPAEEVRAFGKRVPEIETLTVVTEQENEALFEARLHESGLVSTLLNRGAIPQTLRITGEEGYAAIRVPQTSKVRTFVELFETRCGDVELVGRREIDESTTTHQEFEAQVKHRLTERQEEILKTAYVSGFFEWPRETTAQDLAAVLDVTQPTVSRHIRGGEQELFDLVFGKE